MAVVVVSMDGVRDSEFEALAAAPDLYPDIAKFKAQSFYRGGVKSIFVTNTYPVHATVSTGKLPKEHGVVSNFTRGGKWAQAAKLIKAPTIWDAARAKGLTTAAILWPTTCGASIKWNLPEAHAGNGRSQLVENLRHGSALFQLRAFARHGGKLRGIQQPYLDDFTTAVACDLLREKAPDLTLIHLLAYDMICHQTGNRPGKPDVARKSLDNSLGRILAAAGGRTVIVFSDHGHLDVEHTIDLRGLFGAEVYEQCGGSAFFRAKVQNVQTHPWFGRLLTGDELEESGYAHLAPFGVAAAPGYCFGDEPKKSEPKKSEHGYPADYDKYGVFYAVNENAFAPSVGAFGDLRDVTAIISRELELGIC